MVFRPERVRNRAPAGKVPVFPSIHIDPGCETLPDAEAPVDPRWEAGCRKFCRKTRLTSYGGDLQAGDHQALTLVCARPPLVFYHELRRVAHHRLRRERPDHTLQSNALVHETYLRLEKQGAGRFKNREHFVAVCAQLMRQILVDYARSRSMPPSGMEAAG